MSTDYDPSNQRHVSALAEALRRGPLEWSTMLSPATASYGIPDRWRVLLLVCRFPDGREMTMPTLTRSERDVERLTAGVSRALLADVVAGLD